MSNILQHNRKIFDLQLNKSDYWDFHLCVDNVGSSFNESNNCKSAEIDFNNSDCVWFEEIHSKPDVVWENAKSTNISLNSIGFTGVDNGLIKYEKDQITNKEFLDIFLDSHYNIQEDNKSLTLYKVNGNNQIYDYTNDIVILDEENKQVAKLNGGFYQGFFKLDGYDYQTMPTSLGQNGWTFEFDIKKETFENNNLTLNEAHPNNKGIFFYMGTRAENKWYKGYKISEENVNSVPSYENSDYSNEYFQQKDVVDNVDYQTKEEIVNEGNYFNDQYVKKDDYFNSESDCCEYYAVDEYIEQDTTLPDETVLKTSEGYDLFQPNIIEYKTDNKFITYNRTPDGFIAKDDIDNTEVILYDVKVPNMENYFLLFNRTKDGYTTKTIEKLIEEKNKEYNLLNDIYRNAIAFQINDNGQIGYKYLVKDCDKEDDYKIESEFSLTNIVKENEWYNIKVFIESIKNNNLKCDKNSTDGQMRFYFYVNGKLVLVSKTLPIFNFRKLNDLSSKQEGVPYNISIGGGTQGLCDVIYLNYMNTPDKILPLEREFAGSFIGYLSKFSFYNCKHI